MTDQAFGSPDPRLMLQMQQATQAGRQILEQMRQIPTFDNRNVPILYGAGGGGGGGGVGANSGIIYKLAIPTGSVRETPMERCHRRIAELEAELRLGEVWTP